MRQGWNDDWGVGIRVWLERAGRALLGRGRLELLEGIERFHSISAAARQMNMSYRHAWLMVQRINEAAGEALINAATGGSHGGGAALTPTGRAAVATYREIQEHLLHAAAAILPRLAQSSASPCVHVAAAVSLEEVLGQILTDFVLAQPTIRPRLVFGGSDELADHVIAGAPADLFLSADSRQLERLREAGLRADSKPVIVAENGLAAIGRADLPLHIRNPRGFVKKEIERIALAAPSCPLGAYTRGYLARLGLWETLTTKAVWVDNSRAVIAAVRSGRADMGLVYSSDAVRATECSLHFRVQRPPTPIRYGAALLKRGQRLEQARTLLAFLSSPAAQSRFRRCGFLTVPSHKRGR